MGGKRLTYESIKKDFEDQGCELLSTEYNLKIKLKFIC